MAGALRGCPNGVGVSGRPLAGREKWRASTVTSSSRREGCEVASNSPYSAKVVSTAASHDVAEEVSRSGLGMTES
jgi:hypothetical protein